MTNNISHILSLARTWILGCVGAVVLIAALYTAFIAREFVVPGEDIYDGIVYINTPGSTQIAGMEGYGVTTYGEKGLVVNKSLKDDAKKILFWGDSFVEAIHVSDRDKFTEIVERDWNKKFPEEKIQALNIGQAGLDTRAYIQFGSNVDDVFSPDLVFLMLGAADFEPLTNRENLVRQIEYGDFDNLLKPESATGLRKIINDIGLHAFAGRFKRQTFAFLKGGRNKSAALDTSDDLNKVYLHESIEIQLDALLSIWGDRLVIIYRHRISDYGHSPEEGRDSDFYKTMVQKNIKFIDSHSVLSEAMKEGRPPHGFMNFKLGHGHLNHIGHKVVADLVVNYLEEMR